MSGIIRLTVSNLLRIRAAEVHPDGSLVLVAGANDQGKSSLLRAISMALSGKDLPEVPVRKGTTSGYVILETEEITVTRKFSTSGASVLEVRDREGVKITPAQAKLDTLVSRVSFDPFEFTKMEAPKQLETLRKIVGLDFTDLDKRYKDAFDARTTINRQAKLQEAKLQSIVRHTDALEEVVIGTLLEEIQAAEETNRKNDSQREVLSELNDDVDEYVRRIAGIRKEMEKLEAQLKVAETESAETIARRDELKAKLADVVDIDIEPLRLKITNAEATNEKARANKRWNEEHKLLIGFQAESDRHTDFLAAILKEKSDRIEKATFPVPGLGFADAGVTYNDIPFDQAGTAVKIRTSIAIARSLNPALPVMFIKDGSLLDADSLELVREEADKHGLQVWLEMVGSRDDATVVIEDGEVIATPAADAKRKQKIPKAQLEAEAALEKGETHP